MKEHFGVADRPPLQQIRLALGQYPLATTLPIDHGEELPAESRRGGFTNR